MNIALIGFRASGKSLLGKILARRHRLAFVDMDERLVARFGQDIDRWVQTEGWESFRRAESDLLAELSRQDGQIVATGGGVVLNPGNRRLLKIHFRVIWLKASLETTLYRLENDPQTDRNRPPLTTLPLREEIAQTLAARVELYGEVAEITIETDNADPTLLVAQLEPRLWPDQL